MDEDPWILSSSNYEKHPRKEDVVNYDDDNGDDSSESTQQPCPMMTQSSFLVPKINLGAQNKSPTCKDTLGATVMYGLVSSPGISHQNDQELFVLDKHLLTEKKLNPMAKEFKPSFGGNFPPNDFASMASKPAKMSTQTVKYSAPLSADDKLLLNIEDILKKDKLLILMRGCPGSGKSTLANKIMKSLENGKIGVILSTDNFFNMGSSHYQYDSAKLPGAHSWNKSQAFTAMNENRDLIIIDNTNVSKWEMSPYVKMAEENRYKVMLVEPNTKWKFNARRLARQNIHSVSVQKIEDMLSRYEKNVTVEQLLNFGKTKETKSSTKHERNIAKTQMKGHPKRNKSCRDRNNNSNSNSHSSSSPSEVIKNPRDDIFTVDEMFSVCSTDFEVCNNRDSWGSDDWYEPRDQRRPKEDAIISNMENDFSDEGSSSADAFQEQVFEIQQSLNKGKPKVKSLSSLALTRLEDFNNKKIYESASLATVTGCQMKDQILLDCFKRNRVKAYLPPNFTDSSNEENSAYSIDYQTESLRSSTSEDSIDISSEEHSDFYLLLSLNSDFLHLLTQIFGPIDNLNMEEMNPNKNVDLKLNYNHMKRFHQTLTQICAPNKETSICKQKKKESHSKINRSAESSVSTNFSKKKSSAVSLSEIMKEQEESACELKHKLQNNDEATTQKHNKLCLEFPGTDPSVIEKIFQENDYNMHTTLSVLKGQPQQTAIDWRFNSNIRPTPSPNNNSFEKTRNKHCFNWLKISKEDEYELFKFYSQRRKDNMNQSSLYSNGHLFEAAAYFAQQVGEFNTKMKTARLNWLKQDLASSLTYESYNRIDLHGLNKSEARFLVTECLKDYSEALKTTTSMKNHLIFITGKGANSKNKKPILKPHIISYLEKHRYSFTEDSGVVKVLL